MAEMGRYCKAYYARQFKDFPEWRHDFRELRPEINDVDGEEIETPRTELGDDDILYLQENYVVTDGIFLDQNVVFGAVTPAWQEFCRDVLKFEIPADCMDSAEAPAPVATAADA